MKQIIIVAGLIISSLSLNAQVLKSAEVYPPNMYIKTRTFNGIGKGYWSLEKTDSLGRIVEEASYRKKEMTGKSLFVYNSHNDVVQRKFVYDINHPNQLETWDYRYTYDQHKIIKEEWMTGGRIQQKKLIAATDSVLMYEDKLYVDSTLSEERSAAARQFKLTFDNGLLISKEEKNANGEIQFTRYEYFPNRLLKRRVITRDPIPTTKMIYTGAPGSDDQSWFYEFDKEGRVKRMFTVVEGKTYKMAEYNYRQVK